MISEELGNRCDDDNNDMLLFLFLLFVLICFCPFAILFQGLYTSLSFNINISIQLTIYGNFIAICVVPEPIFTFREHAKKILNQSTHLQRSS